MHKLSSKKGFTLIELLIVIAIIGILAVALLPSILSAPSSARDAGKQASVNNIVTAIEQYYAANGTYPTAASCLDGTADTTETALQGYFKGSAVPTIDSGSSKTPSPSNLIPSSCTKFYYCPLASNRYFVGVAMENSGAGKGRYSTAAATTCDGTANSSTLLTTTSTNVWGILQ